MRTLPPYRGRFAPSPSGPLHFGSLVTAVASYLDAKSHHGEWLLRIEDVDTLRVSDGAEDAIKQALEKHGLHWDQLVARQSERTFRYQQVIDQLFAANKLFYCDCTRKQLQRQSNGVYPGTCRHKAKPSYTHATKNQPASHSIRYRYERESPFQLDDLFKGAVGNEYFAQGDFIVQRRDGLHAYQLAVVIDDIDQQISHVIRGEDILDSTAWQASLFDELCSPTPQYGHLPVVRDNTGTKLSKQTGATAIDNSLASQNLIRALRFLAQDASDFNEGMTCETILNEASLRWSRSHVYQNSNRVTIGE